MKGKLSLVLAAGVVGGLGAGLVGGSSAAARAEPFVGVVERLSSTFRITGRTDGRYVVTVVVERFDDASAATVRIVEKCGNGRSCGASTYLSPLTTEEFESTPEGARLKTRFGGRPFGIEWKFGDPEPQAATAEGPLAIRRYAITANNALNVGCFGDGEATSTVVADPDGAEQRKGRPFPDKLPNAFTVHRGINGPSCTSDSP